MKKLTIFLLALVSPLALSQGVFINDATTLREINGIWINDASTLREIEEIWINDASTLRQIYSSSLLFGGDGGTITSNDPASSYGTRICLRFNVDGTVEKADTINFGSCNSDWQAAGDWIVPNAKASVQYDVRYTNCTGTNEATNWTEAQAAAEDTWIDLGTARQWSVLRTQSFSYGFTCDFEVRDGDGAPPATGTASWTINISNT